MAVALTVAVALGQALRALLAIGSAGEGAHLQFHHALGHEANHLAQQIGVRVFSTRLLRSIMGLSSGFSWLQVYVATQSYPEIADDHPHSARPATALLRARKPTAVLPSRYDTYWDLSVAVNRGRQNELGYRPPSCTSERIVSFDASPLVR
jgi:hypothetical protein